MLVIVSSIPNGMLRRPAQDRQPQKQQSLNKFYENMTKYALCVCACVCVCVVPDMEEDQEVIKCMHE